MFEATLRYNSNSDKHPVATAGEYLDSLLIPGKMLAANNKALPNDLRKWSDQSNLDYYIQPTLADFRVGSNFRDENGRVRRWHLKYAQEIGPSLEELLATQDNVSAADLPENTVRELTASAVEFQETFVPNQLEEQTSKYDVLDDPASYAPKAVVPWFQKIRSKRDIEVNGWILDATTRSANTSLKPCLFLTTRMLRDDDVIDQLLTLLSDHAIEQCFIWIENVDKRETGEPVYRNIAAFVKTVSDAGVSPHFFYGDYFATMLAHLGLKGTTYGTMYGEEGTERRERRGGAGVSNRYYVDGVKDFLKIPAAVDIQQSLGANMCPCDVCSRQFETWTDLADRFQNNDENIQALLKKHHIQVRWEQIRQVESESLSETLMQVKSDHGKYIIPFSASNQIADSKKLDYLFRWKGAIEAVSSRADG
ncbi:hypothetical protein [Haladaptatus sp. NG-WS-4]